MEEEVADQWQRRKETTAEPGGVGESFCCGVEQGGEGIWIRRHRMIKSTSSKYTIVFWNPGVHAGVPRTEGTRPAFSASEHGMRMLRSSHWGGRSQISCNRDKRGRRRNREKIQLWREPDGEDRPEQRGDGKGALPEKTES